MAPGDDLWSRGRVPVRKPCQRCGGEKPPGARIKYCDACRPLAAADRRADRDRRGHQWLADHPDRQREFEAKWRAANREQAAAATRKWVEENRERVSETKRRWNAMNPRQRRRGGISALIVLERDDGQCGICGQDVDPMRFHLDHVIPLACGGDDAYHNIQAAHPRCNQSKRNTII